MKSREQIEDTIQRIVCELLPKMPPQDIRPAYQEYDNASKAIFGENGSFETTGFTPQDNFIYITAKIGSGNALTGINNSGDVTVGYAVDVTFTFYGNQSPQLALCLFSLLEIDHAITTFESFGMYLHTKDNEIAEMREIINEQWFERHEFSVTFLIAENIRSPFANIESNSRGVEISTITAHDNTQIESLIMEAN